MQTLLFTEEEVDELVCDVETEMTLELLPGFSHTIKICLDHLEREYWRCCKDLLQVAAIGWVHVLRPELVPLEDNVLVPGGWHS